MTSVRPRQTTSARAVRELRLMLTVVGANPIVERDLVAHAVIPELQNRLRTRKITVSDFDPLRGLDPIHVTADQIRTLLETIRRTRPVFVGMLGRTRSKPVPSETLLDPVLLEHYPWIEQIAHAGHGLAEIALIEGVLANPLMTTRAMLTAAPGNLAADRTRRLRGRALAAGISVTEAASAEELIASIRNGVFTLIERLFAVATPTSPLDQLRRAQEAFAASRRFAYVEVGDYAAQLDAYVADDGMPVFVTGESGSGKSALLANWAETVRASRPEAFLIEHYAGADSGASHTGVIRRIIEEIRERYGIDESIPAAEGEIVESFPLWLWNIHGDQLILIVDGLNQLAGGGADLSWLPSQLPPSVRLIVSTTDGPPRAELARRGWRQIRMHPLSAGERRRVVTEFLGARSVTLNTEQLRRVSDAKASSNPLFLRMRLEELRAPGPIGDLEARIEGYMKATNLEDLLQSVLDRLETAHGRRLVMNVLTLLHTSRRGLSEADLEAMSPGDCEALPHLLADLSFHLIQREGTYTFFHDRMRQAAAARYDIASLYGKRADPHLRIARYFSTQPMSERRVHEEAWHYRQAGTRYKLRSLIGSLPAFMKLSDASSEYELLGYWLWLGNMQQMTAAYRRGLGELPGSEPTRWTILDRVGVFLHHASELDAADDILAAAAAAAAAIGVEEYVEVQKHRIPVLLELGKYEDGIAICQELLDSDVPTSDPATRIRALISRADGLHYLGELDEAERVGSEALDACERAYGSEHRATTEALHNLALVKWDKDDKLVAESMLRRVIELDEKIFGSEHPELATSIASLSDMLIDSGEHAEAEELARRALNMRIRTLGPEHIHTGHSWNQLGLIVELLGQLDEAEEHLSKALAAMRNHLGEFHQSTCAALANIATLYWKKGDFEGALAMKFRALEDARHGVGLEHPITMQLQCGYGTMLLAGGQLDKAIDNLQSAHDGIRHSLGETHSLSIWSSVQLGAALVRDGQTARAEGLLNDALARTGDGEGETATIMQALVSLAEVRMANGRREDAARLASQAIDLSPRQSGASSELLDAARRVLLAAEAGDEAAIN